MKSATAVAAVLVLVLATGARAFPIVVDDFDGGAGPRVTGSTVDPDNSGNTNLEGAPGVFPSSSFDVFGRTNRKGNFDFADDSLTGLGNPAEFPTDSLGCVPWNGPGGHDQDDHFFGTNDVDNGDNPGGGGTATWTIDISGLSGLVLEVDLSAMGDFEAGDNTHSFGAQIDGGAVQALIAIDADEDYREGALGPFTYTMEDGDTVDLNDPLAVTDDLGTRVIDNTFTTVGRAAILGTGDELVLTYTAGPNNGSSEPFAFDNVRLTPEPTTLALVAVGGATLRLRRRRQGP